MKPRIIKANSIPETQTYERCSIAENYSDQDVSLARARVKIGETTVWHHLNGVQEIYLIAKGHGKVEVGNLKAEEVKGGDVVVIPPGVSQRITNLGKNDLVFFCICTPKFTVNCYIDEEAKKR